MRKYVVTFMTTYSNGMWADTVELEEDEKAHQVKLSIKDFDYRIGKKKVEKIQETEHGFTTLESKLGDWIEEKYKEITKK